MKVSQIVACVEDMANPYLQESYDNAGLIIGDAQNDCTGVLVCLDALPEIIEEAIARNCNLIIAHHPIVFKGLKKINGKNYIEQTVIKAIKNDIAIYAIHTNLDNILTGVNRRFAEKIGLKNLSILRPRTEDLLKLEVFVPNENKEQLLAALFAAGAGLIGNYSECAFVMEGQGMFKPEAGADPTVGTMHQRHTGDETKIEVILPVWKRRQVLAAMIENHPYEEVAYYLFKLENTYQETGSGMVGELPEPMGKEDFLKHLKESFKISKISHTDWQGDKIRKVALCGGAGIFLLPDAIRSKADTYVTSDIKYHEFFDAEQHLLLADIGHYQSEQFTVELIAEHLSIKFPNFAVLKTDLNTNPVRYT